MTPTNIPQPNPVDPPNANALPKIDRSASCARQAQLSAFIGKLLEPQPRMTPREQAWSYIQELKQLILEDGGSRPVIFVQAEYGPNDIRNIGINIHGQEISGGLFAGKAVQS